MIGLDKDICMLSKHVYLNDGKLEMSADRRLEARWIGLNEEESNSQCLRTLFKLEGHEFNIMPPERYLRTWSCVNNIKNSLSTNQAWSIVDSSKRLLWIKNTLNVANDLFKQSRTEYQVETFAPSYEVIKSFRPFKVSEEIDNCDDPTASTFVRDKQGFVNPPVYNRFGTRTGRMTISSGARVLTSRISTRNLILPVNEDYALVYLDYSSLEARIALALAGKPATALEDPYEVIGKAINISSRDDAKNATLAAIFSDPTSNEHQDIKVSLVRRVFKLGEMYLKLSSERKMNNGRVRNLYGRLIDVTSHATLYNNYIQSTGADVVLLGLLTLLKPMLQLNIIPHFVLHDALFASVPKNHLSELQAIGLSGVNVPKIDAIFPLKMTIIN